MVHDDFVKDQLRSRREKHDVLLQRIPAVPNLQAAWLLYFTLRTVRLALVEEFAASHNHAIWTCLVKILGIDGSAVSEAAKQAVTLPLSTGGLGIQNATRALPVAQWASWVDALEMIRKRHPGVVVEIIFALDQGHSSPSITAVRDSKEWLEAAGRDAKLGGVGAGRHQGWQRSASVVLEKNSLDELRRQLTEPERALMLSQGGPMSAEPFSSFPTSRETRFDSQPFRLLLLPSSVASDFLLLPMLLDVFGHHRAACATVGVLGRRGFALESAAARVCREAGGRVRRTCLCGNSTSTQARTASTLGVWKWWWTVWSSSMGPNWQWTPFWSQHSAQTGPLFPREQQWVEKPWKSGTEGENQNSLAREVQKWVDVGQTKLPSSCVLWRS